jgi:hypothetical protein
MKHGEQEKKDEAAQQLSNLEDLYEPNLVVRKKKVPMESKVNAVGKASEDEKATVASGEKDVVRGKKVSRPTTAGDTAIIIIIIIIRISSPSRARQSRRRACASAEFGIAHIACGSYVSLINIIDTFLLSSTCIFTLNYIY